MDCRCRDGAWKWDASLGCLVFLFVFVCFWRPSPPLLPKPYFCKSLTVVGKSVFSLSAQFGFRIVSEVRRYFFLSWHQTAESACFLLSNGTSASCVRAVDDDAFKSSLLTRCRLRSQTSCCHVAFTGFKMHWTFRFQDQNSSVCVLWWTRPDLFGKWKDTEAEQKWKFKPSTRSSQFVFTLL